MRMGLYIVAFCILWITHLPLAVADELDDRTFLELFDKPAMEKIEIIKTNFKKYSQQPELIDKDKGLAYLLLGYVVQYEMGGFRDTQLASELYQNAINYGANMGHFFLGRMYFNGEGVQNDYNRSFRSFLLLAQYDIPEVNYYLAKHYYFGYGTTRDPALAFKSLNALLTKHPDHADGNYLYGHFKLITPENGQIQYNEAVKYLTRAATKGHVLACNELGKLYIDGNEKIPINIELGERFYIVAAQKLIPDALEYFIVKNFRAKKYDVTLDLIKKIDKFNNHVAYNILAEMYINGFGLKQDVPKAIHFYQKASDLGNVDAMLFLGKAYIDGKQVPRNSRLAMTYLQKASASPTGSSEANFLLGRLYAEGDNIDPLLVYNKNKMIESGDLIEKDIAKTMELWKKAADAGNANAQFELAQSYIKSDDEQSIKRGLEYLQKSVAQGHVKAMTMLGELYYSGELLQRNLERANKLFSIASKKNESRAIYFLGIMSQSDEFAPRNLESSRKYFYTCALMDNSDCAYKYAQLTFDLPDINQFDMAEKKKEALNLLHKAANAPLSHALYYLGVLYKQGEILPLDDKKSKLFIERAASLGNQLALRQLGLDNYPIKIEKSREYFQKAMDNGDTKAIFYLGLVNWEQPNGPEDKLKGLKYLEQASAAGVVEAQFYFANVQLNILPNGDKELGMKYLRKAANSNHQDAQLMLANAMASGQNTAKNVERAAKILEQLASYGNIDALNSLAMVYFKGELGKPEIAKAINLWEMAARLGNPDSLYQMGYLYERGEYKPKNISVANDYYKKAAKFGNEKAAERLRNNS